MSADIALALEALERRLVAADGGVDDSAPGYMQMRGSRRVRGEEGGARVCWGRPSVLSNAVGGVPPRCARRVEALEDNDDGDGAAVGADDDEGFGAADALEQRLRTCGTRAEAQVPVLAAYCALMCQHPQNTVLLSNILRTLSDVFQNTLFVSSSSSS